MKSLLFIISSLAFFQSTAQTKLIDDTLWVKGLPFTKGQKIKIGRPVQDRDHFAYITASKTQSQLITADDALKGNESSTGFGKGYAGRYMIVKKIVRDGSEEFGYKYFLVCKSGGVMSAWIDIDNALSANEVLTE